VDEAKEKTLPSKNASEPQKLTLHRTPTLVSDPKEKNGSTSSAGKTETRFFRQGDAAFQDAVETVLQGLPLSAAQA